MCMHIGTNVSAFSDLIWFCFEAVMGQHVPHIVLKFQVNILNSSWIIAIYVFLP